MKQFIDSIISERKVAVKPVTAAVLLLLILALTVPFLATIFGTGFFPRAEAVDQDAYAALEAENEALRSKLNQEAMTTDREKELQDQIEGLEAEKAALIQALEQSETEKAELVQTVADAKAAEQQLQARFDLFLDDHSKKFLVTVKLIHDNLMFIPDDVIRFNLYVTAEQFAALEVGEILTGHEDLDFPTGDSWSLVVISKHVQDFSAELI